MRTSRRSFVGLVLIGALSLLITTTTSGVAPSWPQFRFDNAHSGSTPDNAITTANVADLAQAWTGATAGVVYSSPAVAGGVAYVGSQDHKFYAFDAAGTTGCSGTPKTCTPLWTGGNGRSVVYGKGGGGGGGGIR